MRQAITAAALTMLLAATGGCGADEPEVNDEAALAGGEGLEGNVQTVRGCLTTGAEANQFVLTADPGTLGATTARAGTGTVPTYTYQLVGGTNLQQYAGKQVEVRGVVSEEAKDQVEFEKTEEMRPANETPAATTERDVEPKVETTQEVALQLRRMQVQDVRTVAGECQVGTTQ